MKFWEALDKLIAGDIPGITNTVWNGLDKQKMFIFVQRPDENSKMTKPYLYMEIMKYSDLVWEIIRIPRVPSMLDMFSDTWEASEYSPFDKGN